MTGVAYATTGIYSDGYITAGAAASSSDAVLKNQITPVYSALDTIKRLTPREWVWNEKSAFEGQRGAGLVAQEVASVLPFCVVKNGEYLALNYDAFNAYEIAAIQELAHRVERLEIENRELKQKLNIN